MQLSRETPCRICVSCLEPFWKGDLSEICLFRLFTVSQRNFYAAFAGLGHSWSPSTSKRRNHNVKSCAQLDSLNIFSISLLSSYSNRSNHTHKFRHIFARTNGYKFPFFPLVIPLWNGLPNSAVNAESVTDFQANALPSIRQYCNVM